MTQLTPTLSLAAASSAVPARGTYLSTSNTIPTLTTRDDHFAQRVPGRM